MYQTARLRHSGILLYPNHPLFQQRADLEIVELRSDMVVVRLTDGSRQGIPAWMFDPVVCSTVRSSPKPEIKV